MKGALTVTVRLRASTDLTAIVAIPVVTGDQVRIVRVTDRRREFEWVSIQGRTNGTFSPRRQAIASLAQVNLAGEKERYEE